MYIKRILQEAFSKAETDAKNTSPSGGNRILFIDLAKGICILLVIASHVSYFNFLGSEQLRMPLYFILSGLFFKTYDNFDGFVRRKINKLIVPMAFFYVINYLLFYALGNTEPDILSFFYTRAWLNGPIWFLLCLFWVNVIFYMICLITEIPWLRFLMVVGVGVVGYLIRGYDGYLYYLDSAMAALPFFYMGYLIKNANILLPNRYDSYALPLGVLMIACGIALTVMADRPYIIFASNTYIEGEMLMTTYLISALEVVGLLLVCKFIGWLPFVSYFGRYSIISLCIHIPIYQALMFVFERYGIIVNNWIYTLLVVVLCFASIPLFVRFLPHFTAQKNLISVTAPK